MSALRRRLSVVEAFRRLVGRARREGLSVVVDSDAVGVRFVLAEEDAAGKDLRHAGVLVLVHNACGSTAAKVSGRACCDGNL